MAPEFLIGQLVREQVETLQDRQPGLDQRDELLVENKELLEIDGLAAVG